MVNSYEINLSVISKSLQNKSSWRRKNRLFEKKKKNEAFTEA